MEDNSKYLEGLSPKKRALFELLLKEKKGHMSRPLKIPRRRPASSYPLSFTQQRLWILDQLASDRASYNIYFVAHLEGRLNLSALEKSFNEIIRRHEILRTTFRMMDGQPAQVIAPSASLPLERRDLSHLCEPDRQRLTQLYIDEQVHQPFDLSEGPVIRVTLFKNGEEGHVIIIVVHHIVFDGWSIDVFIRELTSLYEAFSVGRPSPLAELPIQFADFAIWQREWLRGHLLEEQLAYWKRELKGADQELELPIDHEPQHERTSSGAFSPFLLGPELSGALKDLSRREGATLFMTLLAAFQTLLHRYSGQEEIFVGSPVAYRNWPETENLIGCFINTLVLRADMSGNPTFRALLAFVSKVAQGAYAHQDLPFDLIVNALQPDRDSTRTPLFRVWFVLQNLHDRPLQLPGLSIRNVPMYAGSVKFDLALVMIELSQGIEGCLHYNRDLFEAGTIEEMKGHFTTLLEQVAENPDLRLLDIPLFNSGPDSPAPDFESIDDVEDYFQPNCDLI
jgi:Condensation domain